jgi:1,4-dihydroxy-2-naphthoyl-CoA hydrolase
MIKLPIDLEKLNQRMLNTIGETLGIEVTEVGEDYISGKMPVDHRTKQPFGILHGGASVVLAESLGSIGSMLCVDLEVEHCVGLGINANHVRSASSGYVYGKASVVHIGKKTHIWDIRITNEDDELVCISRLTVAVLKKK